MRKSRNYYYIMVLLSILWWSAAFPFIRDLVTSGFDPYLVNFVRTVLTVSYFGALILFKRKPLRFLDLKKNFVWLFGMGFFGVAVFYDLTNIGLQFVDAGKSALINAVSPALIVLFGALIFQEPLTKKRIIGTIVSLIGVMIVIFTTNRGLIYHLQFNPVDLLFIGTGLCATLYTVFNRFLGDGIDYTVGLFWCFLIGAVALTPSALPHIREIAFYGLRQWLELIFLGVFCGAVCDLIWYEGMMAIGMGSCGLIDSLTPLFSVTIAWLFLGEQLTPVLIIGALILTLGVWVGVDAYPAPNRTTEEKKAKEAA